LANEVDIPQTWHAGVCVYPLHMHLDNFFFKWHNNIFISNLLRSFFSFFGRCMDAGSPTSCMGSSVLKGKHASSSIQKSQEAGRQADK
jgi:hypothetical protein